MTTSKLNTNKTNCANSKNNCRFLHITYANNTKSFRRSTNVNKHRISWKIIVNLNRFALCVTTIKKARTIRYVLHRRTLKAYTLREVAQIRASCHNSRKDRFKCTIKSKASSCTELTWGMSAITQPLLRWSMGRPSSARVLILYEFLTTNRETSQCFILKCMNCMRLQKPNFNHQLISHSCANLNSTS